MITYQQIIGSESFKNAWMFGLSDKPVYALLRDGTLHEIDGVSEGQIQLRGGEGLHDVIVLTVSEKTSEEA